MFSSAVRFEMRKWPSNRCLCQCQSEDKCCLREKVRIVNQTKKKTLFKFFSFFSLVLDEDIVLHLKRRGIKQEKTTGWSTTVFNVLIQGFCGIRLQ